MAFIGSYGHAPNLDAAWWLIQEVMPLVRAQDDGIECLLVGSNMPDTLKSAVAPGIRPIGRIEDLSGLFDRVRLTVAPLAFGAGVKGKVLDSLAAGVPCACTPIAAEGLDLPAMFDTVTAPDPPASPVPSCGCTTTRRSTRPAALPGWPMLRTCCPKRGWMG